MIHSYRDVVPSIDLRQAAKRSEDVGHRLAPGEIPCAIERYRKFLFLALKHPDTPIAPTQDIDAMWHLHMLAPRAYYTDCMALMGRILDHDGGFGTEPEELPVLGRIFDGTAKLWEQEYGEPYVGDLLPGEATASDDGPFILFVKAVHDFAMGGDPPAPSTFERLAKEELRRRRGPNADRFA